MLLSFQKYQATGNDFVILDNRDGQYRLTTADVTGICDRRFGVGADGLMLIERHPEVDFNLVYFNADGSPSLCGNGSRAAVQMAAGLGLIDGKAVFNAFDGVHEAEILDNGNVRLKMHDVAVTREMEDGVFINTGSPHFVQWVQDVKDYPVFDRGRALRYSDSFKPGGTNVNFVENIDRDTIFVRTYERGVENETLSCGTGVTASALAASLRQNSSPITVKTLGGELQVEYKSGHDGSFTEIFLIGPAKKVFTGTMEL